MPISSILGQRPQPFQNVCGLWRCSRSLWLLRQMFVDMQNVVGPFDAAALKPWSTLGSYRQDVHLLDQFHAVVLAQMLAEVILQIGSPAAAQRNDVATGDPVAVDRFPCRLDALDLATTKAVRLD